ncbi:hypothetical protein MBANPS3_010418 [Mucor bainieri]
MNLCSTFIKIFNCTRTALLNFVAASLASHEATESAAADTDIEISESDAYAAEDAENLCGRAQASLVDGMHGVSVDEGDMLQDMSAQECKFEVVFSSLPTLRSNSICVPLVVQNVVCFGIVDTGATFSCIPDEFFAFLGGTAANDSVVQLAHKSSTLPQVGTVDLKLEYNKYLIRHIFGAFTFYSEENVHGMNILSDSGTGISGLVSQDGFQTGPRLPTDPIDDTIKTNDHLYSSSNEERPLIMLSY